MARRKIVTAEDALRVLADLPTPEQDRLVTLIYADPSQPLHGPLAELIRGAMIQRQYVEQIAVDLHGRLQKHRNPKANAARDAVIVRLDVEGKTAGQIIMALRGRWPLSESAIRSVLYRERKK